MKGQYLQKLIITRKFSREKKRQRRRGRTRKTNTLTRWHETSKTADLAGNTRKRAKTEKYNRLLHQ